MISSAVLALVFAACSQAAVFSEDASHQKVNTFYFKISRKFYIIKYVPTVYCIR